MSNMQVIMNLHVFEASCCKRNTRKHKFRTSMKEWMLVIRNITVDGGATHIKLVNFVGIKASRHKD